jgi:hypothetical protein
MNKHSLSRFSFVFLLVCIVSIHSVIALTESKHRVAPVPLINQPLVPDAIAPGTGDFTLTINGTGFAARSVVQWNGHKRPTHFVSKHRLTAVIRASDIRTLKTASITVATCAPGGGTSNVIYFPVTNATDSISFCDTLITTGIESYSIISGDFNEDGKIDLVVSNNAFDDTISVLLGNGEGTFEPPVIYHAGDTNPLAIRTGDFNEDGHLDLVMRCSRNVCILLGNGDGTFGSSSCFDTIPIYAGYLETADLDGDGHMDVVVANGELEASVSVFLGNGDGTLQSAMSYSAPTNPIDVAVGDYDGDGVLDLAVMGSGVVAILRGNGNGSFEDIGDYAFSTGGFQIVTADFNGDCNLDLAVPDRRGGVSILLGNGDGTFQSPVEYSTDPEASSLAVADLNGDGYLDLITNTGWDTHDTISTLLGNGDGTFQSYTAYEVDGAPDGVAAADFNQDGRLDIATPYGNNTGSILLQNSNGDFSPKR